MDFFSKDAILFKILSIPAILIGLTVHEYAHAKMADKLGDSTPRFQGRLKLDPFTHIDWLGFLFIMIAGFGWAKPVEINPRAFKNFYKDDLKVSIAGPISNLILALAFGLLLRLYNTGIYNYIALATTSVTLSNIILYILYFGVQINVMLFIFNLIPLPGLDGFHVLRDLAPKAYYQVYDKLYKYQMIILIAMVFPIFGSRSIISYIMTPIMTPIIKLFSGF